MKKILLLILFYIEMIAATYYVDATNGRDSNDGLSPETAWQSIAKVNSMSFLPGDEILFARGEIWREQLRVSSSGAEGQPIVFGAYGIGDKPVIDGADVITELEEINNNLWRKNAITIQPNLLYLNDRVGNNRTSYTECSSEGDWYWDSETDIIFVYSNNDPSGNVELGQRKAIVDVANNKFITISDLTIQHSNENSDPISQDWGSGALKSREGSYLTVNRCIIQKNSYFGVRCFKSSNLTFDKNTFLRNGESYKNGSNVMISTNVIGSSDIIFTDNQCNDSGENGLMISGANKSIQMKNLIVSGNHFYNNNGAGLYIIRADSVAIFNNFFEGNGDPIDETEDYAIGIQASDNVDIYMNIITNQKYNDAIQIYSDETFIDGSAHNISIYRNYIFDISNGDGIGIGTHGNQTCQNLSIYYNFIGLADAYGIFLQHSDGGTADTTKIFNNTFYENTLSGVSANVPTIIKNNIFYNNGPVDVNIWGISSGLKTSNNLWYRLSGNVLKFNSINYNMSTIKEFEATAKSTDSLFVDTGSDFSLQTNSPVIDAGIDVGITEDILNNPIVGKPDIGAFEYQSNTDSKISFFAKVFLGGAFRENTMVNFLERKNDIPKLQPFANPPWNYQGVESINNPPENTVDWILVELRDHLFNLKARKAALLKIDGLVADLDGFSPISFERSSNEQYYIVLKHRNHLSIMSRTKVALSSNTITYDFTTSQEKAYGESSMELLSNGKFGMIAGDSNQDGEINLLDYREVANSIYESGYQVGDLDMNGIVNVLDYFQVHKNILKRANIPSIQ